MPKKNYSEFIDTEHNQLTILEIFSKKGFTRCRCKCRCGKISEHRIQSVLSGATKSCGCLLRTIKIGNTYNQLTVLEKSDKVSKDGRTFWKCKCNCGTIFDIISTSISITKSCGCLRYEKAKQNKFYSKYPGNLNSYMWSRIRNSAKYRKIDFQITPEYAWEIFEKQNNRCAISNLPITIEKNNVKNKSGNSTASLDRIDSKQGYVEGNIQWLHKDINLMKMHLNQDYFIQMCQIIAEENNAINK